MVGGAVRDAYLHRPLKDIDLATREDGCLLARRIANRLGGAYYPLDATRGVGRAIIPWEGSNIVVDVAQFRGISLNEDLAKRDLTVNALAVDLHGDLDKVIDFTGGLEDIRQGVVRQCQAQALAEDPIRVLRAVRASVSLGFVIAPDTVACMRQNATRLRSISGERVRDEFMQILGGNRPSGAIKVLAQLGILEQIMPELLALQDLAQAPPHYYDVWKHTLSVVEETDRLLKLFSDERDDNATGNMQHGLAAWTLDVFHSELASHIGRQ